MGQGFVGRTAVLALLLLLIGTGALALLQLWIFWPSALASPSGRRGTAELGSEKVVHYLGLATFTLSTEVLFFITVALAGALGGLIHALRSIALYIGNRRLRWSWIAYYMLLPLIGSLGGTLFYVVLRAGLFSPSTQVDQASPFGFAAVSALAGLFSQQALEKLRQLATEIFTSVPPGADHLREPGGDSNEPS